MKQIQKELDKYKLAFQVACELMNGANYGGINKEYIFKKMMEKDGIVSGKSYMEFIIENIDEFKAFEGLIF